MLPVRRCEVYHPHAGIAAAVTSKWNRVFTPRRRLMAAVEHRLLLGERPPITIALSEYVKRSIRAHYPLGDERLATLFNAVALDYFDPATKPQRPPIREGRGMTEADVVALIVAQDFERKGVPQAVEATGRINASRATSDARLKLLVVGAGHVPGVDGDVIYAGTNWKVVLFYDAADFFVLPTKHDPCSLVVLEALAMGLPVISTVFNGATEIMTDGVHGYVLKDPTDVDALAAAMRRMLDPERRRAMREACLALRPRLSYEHHVDQLLRIYERARSRA
jgi:UDP-glucose:(heptosyl)LPS alpha-1,3-glucosyltransferase